MASGEKYIVSLKRHIFRAPHPAVSISAFLIIVLLITYLVHPNLLTIFHLFLLPFLIAVVLDYLAIRWLRIYFPLRRIASLNLFAFILSFIQFGVLQVFFPFNFSFYLAFASIIDPRYVLYRTFLAEKKNHAVLVSLHYTIILFLVSLLYDPSFPLIPFVATSLIYLGIGYLFIKSSTSPFRREFRADPLFFIASFLNYLSLYRKEDEDRINRFFYEIYTDRKVPVSAMIFKGASGIKAVLVAPYMHPGPFGSIGGSDIPNKLERALGMDNLMVFHTTTTHDNNIADEKDVKKIAEALREIIKGECEYSRMSDLVRFRVDGVAAMAQIFGDYAFLALIPEKAEFDDVELSTGLAARKIATRYFKDAMVIDAHNCFDENALPLSLTHHDISEFAPVLNALKADKKLRMGFAKVEMRGESIGPGGVRAAVFEYGEKRIAYILLDGNNVKRGLRDEIRKAIDFVDEIEVFSTDNHLVNATMMDVNPVGERDSWEAVVGACVEAVRKAMENIEDVCVYMGTKEVELRMAPAGTVSRMSDVTKEGIKKAKVAVPVLFAAGFLASLLIFLLLG